VDNRKDNLIKYKNDSLIETESTKEEKDYVNVVKKMFYK
jgi:hypothetical protein